MKSTPYFQWTTKKPNKAGPWWRRRKGGNTPGTIINVKVLRTNFGDQLAIWTDSGWDMVSEIKSGYYEFSNKPIPYPVSKK